MARPDKKKDDKNKRSSRNNLFKRRKFCRFTVDKIAEVETTSKGPHGNVPVEPVIIKSVKVVS